MDLKGFELLYKTYQPQLVNFAFYYLKQEQEAIDTVQELFVNLWEKRETINLSSHPKSYLRTAVKNRCINKLTRKKIAFTDSHLLQDVFVDPQTPIMLLESKQTETTLIQLINAMPERCREIFILSRFEQMSYKEIAAFLGITSKTVENQIANALKLLRKHHP